MMWLRNRSVRRALCARVMLALGFVSLGACAHVRRAPMGYNVSSVHSDYSPAVQLAVAIPLVDSSAGRARVTVVIDSGTIVAPGAATPDTTPVMRDLYLTALIVTAAPASNDGPPKPWASIAQSDSVPLADALRIGVARPVPRLELHVETNHPIDVAHTWLAFRIHGAAMTEPVRMADGQLIPARRVPGGVRVYACTDWTLAGYVDRRRAKALASAYNAAC
jgi:hypothetical protein